MPPLHELTLKAALNPLIQSQAPIITRFAPSPTGQLHLGHIASAAYVWGIAQALKARVLLRLEDHDRIRSRSHYEDDILKDLEWLGFEPSAEPTRQRDQAARYELAMKTLPSEDVYPCECSRKVIQQHRPSWAEGLELFYPGICRQKNLALKNNGLRFVITDNPVHFTDALLGPTTQTPAKQCGDLLIRDRDQNWTYQFCATVDDYTDGVNLIIRGQDIFPSTGRQILLAQQLGRQTPATFAHHPLIKDPDGEKLSKSLDSESIGNYRRNGETPQEVLGLALFAVGLIKEPKKIQASDLGDIFSYE